MNEMWTEDSKVQRSAVILGLGGLLPFWALPAIALFKGAIGDELAGALLGFVVLYGAIICSFMGGTRWGLAMRTPEAGPFSGLLGSVMPPLLAWVVIGAPAFGVAALDAPLMQLLVIAALLAFQLFEDWRSTGRKLLSPWFLRLRMTLVAGVTTPIILALIIGSVSG